MKKSLICIFMVLIFVFTTISVGAITDSDVKLSPDIQVEASRNADASISVSWDQQDQAIRYEVYLYQIINFDIIGGDNSLPISGNDENLLVRSAVIDDTASCSYTFSAVEENEAELDLESSYKAVVYAIKSDGSPTYYWRGESVLKAQGTLTCSITSFLENSDTITLTLIDKEPPENVTVGEVADNTATYQFQDVFDGQYTLRVEKKNHVTREYEVTVNGDSNQEVKIHPLGDINGDGKTNTRDFGMAYAHAQKVKNATLTGYQLKCGDVVRNDGKITSTDAARINAHAQKTDYLYR